MKKLSVLAIVILALVIVGSEEDYHVRRRR